MIAIQFIDIFISIIGIIIRFKTKVNEQAKLYKNPGIWQKGKYRGEASGDFSPIRCRVAVAWTTAKKSKKLNYSRIELLIL